MSGHTPGPWELFWSNNAKRHYIDAGQSQMQIRATSEYLQAHQEELDANARLIASAPELLDVVIALLSAIDGDNIRNTSDEDSTGVLAEFARAAIAKATGEKA